MGADDTERTMIMGCCGSARKSGQTTEYLVKYRDGRRETAPDRATAQRMLTLGGGGSLELVAKQPETPK